MSGMNETPSSERICIAFFGRRNVGKSSLVNAFTGQELAIVSAVKGTTTDPVYKAMELLPLGPVQIIDTPGIDDEGELGQLRIRRTNQVLNQADVAVLVTDARRPMDEMEQALLERIRQKNIPCVVVRNKSDLLEEKSGEGLWVSAKTGENIQLLRQQVVASFRQEEHRPLVSDLLEPGDVAVLVVPIDKAAPKGRLILPQQQTIRDILEAGASALVCRDTELEQTLSKLSAPPKIVITDSQVFHKVSAVVPEDVLLTSFSILMARYKGELELTLQGAGAVDTLKDGDLVLISEGCTHHRQCGDIGTQKLPQWIRRHTGVEPQFHFTSGKDFPEELSAYRLVVHCGGCMLTRRQMRCRQRSCLEQGVPITNYGILIAHLNGILPRSIEAFSDEIVHNPE